MVNNENIENNDNNLEMDLENVNKQVLLLKQNLDILKFNNRVSKLEDPTSIRKIRRHIAKLLTYRNALK